MPAASAVLKLDKRTRQVLAEAAQQEQAIQSMSGFVKYMWAAGECDQRRALTWGWHLELLCRELDGLAAGEAACLACGGWRRLDASELADPECEDCGGTGLTPVRELVVTMPPGHMKSWLCSVLFPANRWLHDPTLFLLTLALDGDLAGRDSRRSRDMILSEAYRTLQKRLGLRTGKAVLTNNEVVDITTGEPYQPPTLSVDQRNKINFENTSKGGRTARGIHAGIIGRRCDGEIVDDPHDAKEVITGDPAVVAARMRETRTIYHGALLTRLNAGGWRLVVHQRLHVADLAGDRIREPSKGTRIVCLPVRGAPDHPQLHPDDLREEGEWLCEAAFNEADEAEAKKALGPRHYAAQFMQRPRTDAGGLFNRAWFGRRYSAPPMHLERRAQFDWLEISVDCNFKGAAAGSDYVAIQTWGWKRGVDHSDRTGGVAPGRYLLDRMHGRFDIIDTCQALKDMAGKWPRVNRVTIEMAANGDAVIQTLRRQGHEKVVGFSPGKHGSKKARAAVAAVSFEAGDVVLPEAEHAPWVLDYIEEMVDFPAGANDDDVDATSQLMIRWDDEGANLGDINAEFGWLKEVD